MKKEMDSGTRIAKDLDQEKKIVRIFKQGDGTQFFRQAFLFTRKWRHGLDLPSSWLVSL